MKNWEDDDDSEYCSTRQDLLDAASVADLVGVEFEYVNFAAEYKDRVFAEFLREYSAGRTPNPDVLCNAEIKFKAFLDHAMALGAEHIATGHYARVREVPAAGGGSEFQLLKALDGSKDQSYFLHRLNQAQLSRTLFPLGEIHKTEVRRIAHEIGLHNAAKKDSTGICFIGERPFREFLNRYLPTEPGPILTPEGQKVGRHEGLSFTRWASARAWAWAASRASSARTAPPRPGTWRAGPGAQPALCGAGSRPSLAVVEPPAGAGRQLGGGPPARGAWLWRQDPLPPGRRGLPAGGRRRRPLLAGVSASAMGRHAGPVRRAV